MFDPAPKPRPGETVIHFRARGFPYEIDLKEQSSLRSLRVIDWTILSQMLIYMFQFLCRHGSTHRVTSTW